MQLGAAHFKAREHGDNRVSVTGARTPEQRTAHRTGAAGGGLLGGLATLIPGARARRALPIGEIRAGRGSVRHCADTLTIRQEGHCLLVDWLNFDIGRDVALVFDQPDRSAIVLNRVWGDVPAQILGRIHAKGRVWLLAPNGAMFGSDARAEVGALVVTGLGLGCADFLQERSPADDGADAGADEAGTGGGPLRLHATCGRFSGGAVINHGELNAQDGGCIALLGGRVCNHGLISARLGMVGLAAGGRVALELAGGRLRSLSVERPLAGARVENRALIQANGGRVLLTARASGATLDAVVDHSGVIEARRIDREGGVIRLLGGAEGGTVRVAGTLDVSASDGGRGGFVDTSGHHVRIGDDAHVATATGTGDPGVWLIHPNDRSLAPAATPPSG